MNQKEDYVTFSDIDFSAPNILETQEYKLRRTPIIATIADTQITPVDIQKMMEAGMNVVRLKLSNTTKGDKMRLLGKVDKAAMNCCKKHVTKDWPVATCVDLKTCVMRTGLLEEDVNFIPIAEGKSILLTYNIADFDSCTDEKVFVDNPYLTSEVKVGMEISIAQDELILHCTEIVNEKTIKCLVTKGGKLSNMDIVCLRGAKRQRPVLSRTDFHIVKFAIEYQVDIIIVNYVRNGETLKKIKQYIGKKLKKPLLIGGICTQEDLDNIDDIAKESDAIMLSRDYLPYELDPSKRYKLCNIQKWLGAKCMTYGKPYLISGGVFQDCLINGEYTDSEVSDVTNALFDGANGFVLKECYDIDNMLEAIRSLNELLRTVEPYTNSKSGFWRLIDEVKLPLNAAYASMLACAAAANQTQAKAIVMPTVTGRTARALGRAQPASLVLTLSTAPAVTRLLTSFRCVVPLMYTGATHKNWQQNIESRVSFAIEYAVKKGWLIYGDAYVTLQRATEDSSFCDLVRTWTVAISKKALVECLDEEEEATSLMS